MGFFTFFIYENVDQEEYNLLPDCAFGPFTHVCCKNCMSDFSAFVLNLRKSGNILFRKMPSGKCLGSSRDSKTSDFNCFYQSMKY